MFEAFEVLNSSQLEELDNYISILDTVSTIWKQKRKGF
jgi:hypothetical protein